MACVAILFHARFSAVSLFVLSLYLSLFPLLPLFWQRFVETGEKEGFWWG
jgi:hypothetical protein